VKIFTGNFFEGLPLISPQTDSDKICQKGQDFKYLYVACPNQYQRDVLTRISVKEGKAQRNARGEITKAASYQSREKPQARIEPNRKVGTP
jgi:hypothetical protein